MQDVGSFVVALKVHTLTYTEMSPSKIKVPKPKVLVAHATQKNWRSSFGIMNTTVNGLDT